MRVRHKPTQAKGEPFSWMLLFSYFTVIFIPLAVFLSAIGWWALYRGAELRIDNIGKRESAQLLAAKQVLEGEFAEVRGDLAVLAANPQLQGYLEGYRQGENEALRQRLEQYLSSLVRIKQRYSRVSLFNSAGELLIEVDAEGAANTEVDGAEVDGAEADSTGAGAQNYPLGYLKQINTLPPAQVQLALTGESRLARGEEPLLRFGTPLFDPQENRSGLLVLEVLGGGPIRRFLTVASAGDGQGIALASSGRLLAAAEPKGEPAEGLAIGSEFSAVYPGEWRIIAGLNEGRLKTDHGLFVYQLISVASTFGLKQSPPEFTAPAIPALEWVLLIHVPSARLPAPNITQHPFEIIAYLIFLTVAALLFSYAAATKSSREASQRNLRASQNRFRVIFQEAGLGIAITDLNGAILYANPALQRLLKYEEAELQHIDRRHLMVKEDGEQLTRLYRRLLRGDSNLYTAEIQYVNKSGKPLATEVNLTLIKDVTGQPQFIVLFVDDMTERKQILERSRVLQDQLVQMDRISAIGEMGTTIAHELNNPLGAIANYAAGSLNWVEKGGTDPQELIVPLQKTLNQARHAGEIIRRLRGYLKTSKEDNQLKDIREVVGQVVQLVEVQAKRYQVKIIPDLPDNLPALHCGQVQLEQVLVNVVLNAIQAIEKSDIEDPVVTISACRMQDDMVELSVTDNGPGVSEPDKIFEPFYTTKAQGLGFGLPICTTIVESWGGRIGAENIDGGGLKVSFTVPHANE